MFNEKSWNQSIDLKMVAENTTAIVNAGTYAAGNLPINGSLANPFLGLFNAPTPVTINSAGNNSSVTFAITGVSSGLGGVNEPTIITEYITGPNAGTVTSLNTFLNVISIIPSANTLANVIAGNAADNNGLCTLQAGSANTPLVINGAYLSGQYNLPYPQFLLLTCAADESENIFTFFGQDQSGAQYTYMVQGVDNSTVVIPIPYQLIGNDPNGNIQGYIQIANNAAGSISIGIAEQTATPWIQCDQARPYFNVGVNVILSPSAALTYTVETTLQNAIRNVINNSLPDSFLVNSSNPLGATLLNGPTAFFRLVINSWTSGYATLLSAQTGSAFSGYITDRRPR